MVPSQGFQTSRTLPRPFPESQPSLQAGSSAFHRAEATQPLQVHGKNLRPPSGWQHAEGPAFQENGFALIAGAATKGGECGEERGHGRARHPTIRLRWLSTRESSSLFPAFRAAASPGYSAPWSGSPCPAGYGVLHGVSLSADSGFGAHPFMVTCGITEPFSMFSPGPCLPIRGLFPPKGDGCPRQTAFLWTIKG